jgi:hypothetical protein
VDESDFENESGPGSVDESDNVDERDGVDESDCVD